MLVEADETTAKERRGTKPQREAGMTGIFKTTKREANGWGARDKRKPTCDAV